MNYRPLFCQIDEDILARLQVLAQANGRPVRDEVEHAIRRHLDAPPTVQVVTPPLPPDEVAPPVRRRGRPRKGA